MTKKYKLAKCYHRSGLKKNSQVRSGGRFCARFSYWRKWL